MGLAENFQARGSAIWALPSNPFHLLQHQPYGSSIPKNEKGCGRQDRQQRLTRVEALQPAPWASCLGEMGHLCDMTALEGTLSLKQLSRAAMLAQNLALPFKGMPVVQHIKAGSVFRL